MLPVGFELHARPSSLAPSLPPLHPNNFSSVTVSESEEPIRSTFRNTVSPLMRLFWGSDNSSVRLHESSNLAALSILIDDIPVGHAAIFCPAADCPSLMLSTSLTAELGAAIFTFIVCESLTISQFSLILGFCFCRQGFDSELILDTANFKKTRSSQKSRETFATVHLKTSTAVI